MIVEVAAYDFEDRMANIAERVQRMAEGIKQLLAPKYEGSVSVTFIPVRQGYWAKV